jgi:hypothetical protein
MAKASFLAGVSKATDVDKINSAIFYAPTGSGKTWLGASADDIDDYKDVLIVDIEGSAAGVGRKYPNVDIVTADTFDKLEIIKDELLNNEHPYKTVLFDTLNVAQDRAEVYFGDLPKNRGNKFGKWEDLQRWTIEFVREMHHADFLAIFLAHPQVDKDENTGRITTTVKIKGGARDVVPTIPDMIGYLDFDTIGEKVERVLYVGGTDGLVTKNRFGLDQRLIDPTMTKIQFAILAAKEEGN